MCMSVDVLQVCICTHKLTNVAAIVCFKSSKVVDKLSLRYSKGLH